MCIREIPKMIDMTTVIAKMFMLFAIMITGFITSRLGVIDETANKKFSTLVVNITAPANTGLSK